MKRFPFVLLAASAAAMTACTGTKAPPSGGTGATGATGPAVAPPPPGQITVQVSCSDTGNGLGVMVRPWRVGASRGDTLTWHLVPASDTMPTTLSPVVDSLWPFDSASYTWSRGSRSIPVKADADTITYRYRLTIACPADTIVIDPEIIVN